MRDSVEAQGFSRSGFHGMSISYDTGATNQAIKPAGVLEEATVLVIDDEPSMHDILMVVGNQHGFSVHVASDASEGLRMAESLDCDLIVIDLNLAGMGGLDICRRLRGNGIDIPIVMVGASSDPVDVVVSLEVGADDYIAKPFEVRELAARINAKLRRQRSGQNQVRPGRLKFPGLVVDVVRHEVLRDGEMINLTPTEFDLLALLAASPGRVVSRGEMIQKVWGQGADLDLRSVDAHVYRLRRKIEPPGPNPTYVHAVPGIGYRFERRGLTERLAASRLYVGQPPPEQYVEHDPAIFERSGDASDREQAEAN